MSEGSYEFGPYRLDSSKRMLDARRRGQFSLEDGEHTLAISQGMERESDRYRQCHLSFISPRSSYEPTRLARFGHATRTRSLLPHPFLGGAPVQTSLRTPDRRQPLIRAPARWIMLAA